MKTKKTTIFLIFISAFALILSVQYLKLRQDYNNLFKDEQNYLASNLSQSSSIGYGLDLNKVAAGDKDSISSLLSMYEYISNCNAILRITGSGGAAVIDRLTLQNYRMALRDIVHKSINGELSLEDEGKLNMITEDIRLIYKYVYENDKFSEDNFNNEVVPKLKLKNPL